MVLHITFKKMKDLLQTPELIPENVQAVLDTFDESKSAYEECERIQRELKSIGYTVDYDLSGNLIDLHKTKEIMNTDRIETVWGFVEKYYPDYGGCDDILWNDDLTKIVDDEELGGAEDLYNSLARDLQDKYPNQTPDDSVAYKMGIQAEAQKLLNESNAYIFEKAIQGFIEQQK